MGVTSGTDGSADESARSDGATAAPVPSIRPQSKLPRAGVPSSWRCWATVWVAPPDPADPGGQKPRRVPPPSVRSGPGPHAVPIRCGAVLRPKNGEPVPIPYCARHLRSGDAGALAVAAPSHSGGGGRCLVARADLPAGYRMAFFGKRGRCPPCTVDDRAISFYPPNRRTGRNTADGRLNNTNYNGVLRPEGTGDLIQYAACPGPSERQNMRSTFQYWGVRNGENGGLEFVTTEEVKAGTQLCHWYGSGWFPDRGLKRLDVGTEDYPAPKRRSKIKAETQHDD
mmetsp:Transcript_5331/g.11242  ORF Transcript_5331/g.11242 Transcript_5331/m.11242 type:complete len:283 (+) Transcript_5331:166-1014(+)